MTVYRYICGCGYYSERSPADPEYDEASERERQAAYERDAEAHHAFCCAAQQRGEDGPCHEAGGGENPACPVYSPTGAGREG